jgi:ankyrin repeat protein
VTIYFLKDNYKYFDPNAADVHGGTPLHYAIMSIEEYNIHALMSLGSDINRKDKKGDSVLHVALARYIDDQENYGLYKEMIKSILQFGAKRDVRNDEGLTPIELLRSFEPRVILKTREDYIREGVENYQDCEPENQY